MTLGGDLMALGAAAMFAVYLSIGSELRAWMPLFLYAVPVRSLLLSARSSCRADARARAR